MTDKTNEIRIATSAALSILILLNFVMPASMAEEDTELASPELHDGFVYVTDYIPDAILDIRYAGTHNFTGRIVDGYEANTAILTREACEKLILAADEFRKKGYLIKIFDAYRPARAVKMFVKWAQNEDDRIAQNEFYPEIKRKSKLLDEEYIARNSAHCKGSAIDLTLTDMQGNELDMGTCFDYFGIRSWHGASGLTEEQNSNRKLLRSVMEKFGFKAFEHEWWHYRLRNQPFTGNFDFPVK